MQGNLRLMERWFEALTAHDIGAVADLFSDDIVYKDIALGLEMRGHSEVVDLMCTLYRSFPDYAVRLVSAVADEHRGGAEMTMTGTHEHESFGMPATGKTFAIPAAAAVRFAKGRITHWSDYWSVQTFRDQVGLR